MPLPALRETVLVESVGMDGEDDILRYGGYRVNTRIIMCGFVDVVDGD
jgi:hypothetical protein